MYRGPAIIYQIRKTTTNNKTGDNYSITIPRIIAEQFNDMYFRIAISGNNILFTSGCKVTATDIKEAELIEKQRQNLDGRIIFK